MDSVSDSTILYLPNTTYASTSLIPLPTDIRNGMIAMGTLGLISTFTTSGLLLFITYRMVYWRKFYDHSLVKNQIFILLYNLLLADLQQAMSFLFSFHWIALNELIGPNSACFAQAWLIQIGDVSSGLWVLAIAIHTFNGLVIQKQISMPIFTSCVVSIWVFAFLLTSLGPILHNSHFFIPSGAWCWITEEQEKDRLYLHYLWIFIAQLGSLVIYSYIFFHLRISLSSSALSRPQDPTNTSSNSNASPSFHKKKDATGHVVTVAARPDPFARSRQRIMKTARYMVVYPIAYIALTLPLAAGRVSSMAGRVPSTSYFPVAGALMASCGFVDVMLYIYTRKALIQSTVVMKGSDTRNYVRPQTNSGAGGAVRMSNMRDGAAEEDIHNDGYSGRGPSKDLPVLKGIPADRIMVHQSTVVTQSEDSLQRGGSAGGVENDGQSVRSDSLRSLVGPERRKGRKDFKFWEGSD